VTQFHLCGPYPHLRHTVVTCQGVSVTHEHEFVEDVLSERGAAVMLVVVV